MDERISDDIRHQVYRVTVLGRAIVVTRRLLTFLERIHPFVPTDNLSFRVVNDLHIVKLSGERTLVGVVQQVNFAAGSELIQAFYRSLRQFRRIIMDYDDIFHSLADYGIIIVTNLFCYCYENF